MRFLPIAAIGLLLSIAGARAAEDSPPLSPVEAASKVGETVTVEMEVKAAHSRGEFCFLNSESDRRDDKNFTIFIGREGLAKFKEAKIDDPAAHFKGKTIQVKGKVAKFRERPQIVVTNPDAIKIVEKK